jgi:hypothetical protein
MRSRTRRHPFGTSVVAGLALALVGCGGASASRLSTAALPSPASRAAPSSTIAAPVSGVTAIAGTATAGPGSTINTAPAGGTPPPTAPRAPPSSSPSTLPPPAPAGSGAFGYVTAGPTCPVERPDQPCPPRPVAAHIQALDASGHNIAATDTDSAGRYMLVLPPGTYTLAATTGATLPRCSPAQVSVLTRTPSRADISCDTGIR